MLYQISIRSQKILLVPAFVVTAGYFCLLQYSFIHLSLVINIVLFLQSAMLTYGLYALLKEVLPKHFFISQSGHIIYQQISYRPTLYLNNFFGWFFIGLEGKSLWVLHSSMLTPKDTSRIGRLLRS